MDYSVWINEYKEQMFRLNSVIKRLQNELKNCKDIDEEENLKHRIQSIRTMTYECNKVLGLLEKRVSK